MYKALNYTKNAVAGIDGQRIIRSGVEASIPSAMQSAFIEVGPLIGKLIVIFIVMIMCWVFWSWLRGTLNEQLETMNNTISQDDEPVARPKYKSKKDMADTKEKTEVKSTSESQDKPDVDDNKQTTSDLQ
jgi:hypothetical protein